MDYSADIIFTDIQMPGMSGYDFAKEIRNKGQNIFIAGVTGYDSEDDRQKSSDSGINYIIKKPYTKESITKSLSEISELLGGA
ncbi:MAG TPA: response regulator [Tepiditoga sp.]|nr:response regulator [Tepiditoga sp.]